MEMSWEATSAVVQMSKQKGSGYLLMLLLANHANGNGYSWMACVDWRLRRGFRSGMSDI